MAIIDIHGANFYYELHGSGQPLVLVAGYNADTTSWGTITQSLSKHYQVLIFDNRGIGKTIDDGRELNLELMADDVVTLIRKLNLLKPHILGLSMGGSIVQHIANKYGDEFNKLVLMCTTAKWRQSAVQGMEFLIKLCEQNIDISTVIDGVLPWIVGEKFLSNKAMVDEFVKNMFSNPNPPTIPNQRRQVKALANFDGRELIKKIANPTLVISGIEDILSLVYESDYLAENITQAQLVRLACAHLPHLEITEEFVHVVKHFLG